MSEQIEKAVIKKEHEVTDIQEISVDWNCWNFLVIYGRHINGWFCAIPNWQKSFEIGNPEDTYYNEEKLSSGLRDKKMAKALAEAIKEHWNLINNKEEKEDEYRNEVRKQRNSELFAPNRSLIHGRNRSDSCE